MRLLKEQRFSMQYSDANAQSNIIQWEPPKKLHKPAAGKLQGTGVNLLFELPQSFKVKVTL